MSFTNNFQLPRIRVLRRYRRKEVVAHFVFLIVGDGASSSELDLEALLSEVSSKRSRLLHPGEPLEAVEIREISQMSLRLAIRSRVK